MRALTYLITIIAMSSSAYALDINDDIGGPDFNFIESSDLYAYRPPESEEIIFGWDIVKFKDWGSSLRNELLPFVGYQEPTVSHFNVKTNKRDPKLKEINVLEARFGFVVNRSFESIKRGELVSLNFLRKLDKYFIYKKIDRQSVRRTYDPQIDDRDWCVLNDSLCVESTFELGSIPAGAVTAANQLLGKKLPNYIKFQTEINYDEGSKGDNIYSKRWKRLTQRTFYINHYFQFGTTHIYMYPFAKGKTLVVGAVAIGVERDILEANIKVGPLSTRAILLGDGRVARLLLGAAGRGVEEGLVPYFENTSKRLYELLSR